MSAFAALKNNPFGESIFNNTSNGDNHSRDDVEEDEVVQYIANSSDEDDDDDDDDNDNDQGNEDNNLFPLKYLHLKIPQYLQHQRQYSIPVLLNPITRRMNQI